MMELVPRHIIGDLDLTDWPFAVIQGASDYGAPLNVAQVIDSMLQDGEIVSSTRSGNRVMSHSVFVEEADMDALAAAEATLIAECDKPSNTWVIDPGDGYGEPTQFDIFRVQVTYVHDDDWEWAGYRRYDLSIPALPFGGAVDEITVTGVTSAVAGDTVINDCSAATNWQEWAVYGSTTPTTPTVSSGNLVIAANVPSGGGAIPYTLAYTPASPVSMSGTPFFYADWKVTGVATTKTPRAWADNVELIHVATIAVAGTAYRRSFFSCPDSSVAAFRIQAPVVSVLGTSYFGDFYLDQIVKTGQAPSTSTLRQKVTTVPVLGSARTPGRLTVAHETSALGYTVVHSYPDLGDGYLPSLRRYLTASGSVTADTALVSGARNAWSGSTFTVPMSTLRKGPYLLWAWTRSTAGTGERTLTAAGMSTKVNFATLNVWQPAVIGVLEIENHPSSTAFTQVVTLSDGTNVEIDEGWLSYIGDDAALTRLNLGTSSPTTAGSSNRLWLETPSAERPYPALWRGTVADQSDAKNAPSDAWGDHQFVPDSATIFTVTTNALDALLTFTHRPRFHTHARKLG